MSFLIPHFNDIIDILMVTYLLYRLFLLLKKTGGYQIIIGIGLILVLYLASSILNLSMMASLIKILKDYWLIAFIILFQPEIRGLLSKVAQLDLSERKNKKEVSPPLLKAITAMTFRKIGALIIIENKRKLDNYIESGEIIDSIISRKLLLTIFNNKTVLHDGAVIIRKGRIWAVKVVLPLSENIEYTKQFGTRHLAAIGITEETDSFAIVVSEETGHISIAKNGEIITNISIEELSQRIKDETC